MTTGPAPAPFHIEPRVLWLALGLTLIALPVFGTQYVPATDLPQHLAQVRLMDEWFGLQPATVDLSLLKLQPFAAHTFIYWPMWLLSRFGSSDLTGRLFVYLMLASCAVTLHFLAYKRERHPAAALGASCFLFSAPLYWGFLNFLCGVPLFVLFVERMLRREDEIDSRRSQWCWLAALCLGMYGTHVFWLIAAALLSPLLVRMEGMSWRTLAWRASAFVPAALATAAWYPGMVKARTEAPVHVGAFYLVPMSERLTWDWFAETIFGGLRGLWEPLVGALILVIALTSLYVGRKRGVGVDRVLLAIGLVLLAFGVLAPDQYMNTILTNRRFMPFAACFLLLAMPIGATRSLGVALGLAGTLLSVITAIVWSLFNSDELTGLNEALASEQRPRTLLTVDLREYSTLIRDRPFLQTFAYFQAEHGGDLNFSFTEHGSSLVAYDGLRKHNWTFGIEWFASRLQARDLELFDCVLVNGSPEQHQEFAQRWGLHTPAREGFFRLYCRE